ncbi:hypothetical protein [Enterovirga sp.]|uniref:hypothetical protein n=1 Tax=Enterovirga sp. TaxID=2026350 RepID=UPI002CCBA1BA|nr:hypothetical protein [Enterovirga sp.]HMO29313.1 hypothetical protein [Enterovirga sp.]
MKLFVVPALGLLLAGCQLVAQQASAPPVASVPAPAAVPASPQAAFVILPKPSPEGVQRYEIRSADPRAHLHDWPLASEIRAFSRMSAAQGGPTYSLAPPKRTEIASSSFDPKECVVDPGLRRTLKSKKPVCYTAEDDGSIVVYTLPR